MVRDGLHEVDVTLRMGSRFDVNQLCFVAPDGRRWRYLVTEPTRFVESRPLPNRESVAVWVSDAAMLV